MPMLWAIGPPPKATRPSAVPIMNQLLISRDCATWPRSRAFESFLPEGSSVRWLSSTSSATGSGSRQRDEFGGEPLEEPLQARGKQQSEGEEARHDLQRLDHEQDLQLRREP